MRIFNRAHAPWFIFVVLATLLAAWLYVGNFLPGRLSDGWHLPPSLVQKPSDHRSVGGTPVGLIFGTTAFAIFVFALLLGLRKKLVLWRIGTVQSWMRAHIWLTLLTIPLVIFHSGFRLGGPMTTLLVVLYIVVMVSGIYGLVLQHQMPRVMMERLPREAVYEQIPYLRTQLYFAGQRARRSLRSVPAATSAFGPSAPFPIKAETLRSMASAAGAAVPSSTIMAEPATAPTSNDVVSEATLAEFLDRQVLPYLAARRGKKFRLGNARFSEDTFRFLKLQVTQNYQAQVAEMQSWCDERRMLDLQVAMQHWLHGWLFVHVPISFLLVFLTAWHAIATLFYY